MAPILQTPDVIATSSKIITSSSSSSPSSSSSSNVPSTSNISVDVAALNESMNFRNTWDFVESEHLTLLNVTSQWPMPYAIYLFGYITPFFFVITVLANIMIVVVLSRPDMRTPTNLVLLAMAIADLLTVLFGVPWYFYLYTLGFYRVYMSWAPLCNMYYYMNDVLPATFHTAAIWCTLLLAVQRYIYICHPSKAKMWCTNLRVTRMIGIIFIAAFLHQAPRLLEKHFQSVIMPREFKSLPANESVIQVLALNPQLEAEVYNIFRDKVLNITEDELQNKFTEVVPTEQTVQTCISTTPWWLEGTLADYYYITYFMFRVIFVHIGPCLALVILNVLLYSALKRAEITRNKLLLKSNLNKFTGPGSSPLLTKNGHNNESTRKHSNANGQQHEPINCDSGAGRRSISLTTGKVTTRGLGSGRDANSTTFMLIVVVTVFLIVEMPLAIATALHVTENAFDLEIVSFRFLNLAIILSNFFIIISYPLNFAIYCGMSRAFRETFQQIFIRRIVDGSSTSSTYCTRKGQSTCSTTGIATASCNIGGKKPQCPSANIKSCSEGHELVVSNEEHTCNEQLNAVNELDSMASLDRHTSSTDSNSVGNEKNPSPSLFTRKESSPDSPKLAITDQNGVTQLVAGSSCQTTVCTTTNGDKHDFLHTLPAHETML